jgi:hypothetical protein
MQENERAQGGVSVIRVVKLLLQLLQLTKRGSNG